MDRDTLLELLPAYALDALTDEERHEVEALLSGDIEARQLLDDYRAIAEILALSAPARAADESVRQRLQQRIRLEDPAAEDVDTPSGAGKITMFRKRLSSLGWQRLGAAAAAVVVVFIGALLLMPPRDTPTPYNQMKFQAITEQTGSQRMAVSPAIEGVQGELAVAPDGSEAVLRLAHLPALAEDQAFQLWLVDDEARLNGGIFHWTDGQGPYYVEMPLEKPLDQYTGFGMTIEPAAGSPLGNEPTGPGVWRLEIASSQ